MPTENQLLEHAKQLQGQTTATDQTAVRIFAALLIADAIRASGVPIVSTSRKGDHVVDLAVWSDDLAPWVGNPLVVEPGVRTGMPILYEPPGDVGADRIVNGVAAFAAYGGPVIVVDFGTATTLDVVTKKGEYLGGVICPGIGISADALFQRAARLPRVDVRKPASVIGRSTVGSMQSGLYFGYASMVEGLIARIRAELGEPAKAVATGGLAESMAADLPSIEAVDPVLTLTGLRLIWERNRASGGR